MKVFGIAGHSGMGKTTLLERLVPELASRGLRVSVVKHSHKDIEVDRPGKDSFRLREAGCREVLLLGGSRWALMHELRGDAEPALDELLDRLRDCDLVLIEGFKQGDFPKLEVWRAAVGSPTLCPNLPGIVAVAGDPPGRAAGALERLSLADVKAVASCVLRHARPHRRRTGAEKAWQAACVLAVQTWQRWFPTPDHGEVAGVRDGAIR